jgi:hypothetical protein
MLLGSLNWKRNKMSNSYAIVSALIFVLVAIMHVVRLTLAAIVGAVAAGDLTPAEAAELSKVVARGT